MWRRSKEIAKRKKKVRFLYALRDDSVADVAASTLGSTSRGVFGTLRDVGVLLVHRGSASARSDVADVKTNRSIAIPFFTWSLAPNRHAQSGIRL